MDQVRLFALGGLDEDGKNMYVVEVGESIFVIEAGLKYPETTDQLGIERIIPDFKYLIENQHRIQAIFISHGHDDVNRDADRRNAEKGRTARGPRAPRQAQLQL